MHQLMMMKLCVCQLQSEVRRSAEKYQAACVACDRSKLTLVNIEQSSSAAVDSAAASFSADKQESLNRANDEVLTTELAQTIRLIPIQYILHCSAVAYCYFLSYDFPYRS